MGMAARADILLDSGENDPKNWDQPFGSGRIHIALSIFSDSEEKWRRHHGIGAAAVSRIFRRYRVWIFRTSVPSRATSIRSATRTA